jgi:hypothetical protein
MTCPKCGYQMVERKELYAGFREDGTGEELECADNWCNYRLPQVTKEK